MIIQHTATLVFDAISSRSSSGTGEIDCSRAWAWSIAALVWLSRIIFLGVDVRSFAAAGGNIRFSLQNQIIVVFHASPSCSIHRELGFVCWLMETDGGNGGRRGVDLVGIANGWLIPVRRTVAGRGGGWEDVEPCSKRLIFASWKIRGIRWEWQKNLTNLFTHGWT